MPYYSPAKVIPFLNGPTPYMANGAEWAGKVIPFLNGPIILRSAPQIPYIMWGNMPMQPPTPILL
jgi:hypothetical protein